jgi:hypothetical protein
MMSARRGRALPPAEAGKFGAAVANSYMWGFWLGVLYFSGGWVRADLAERHSSYLLMALGITSVGWAKFWDFILFFVIMSPVGQALREYYRFTGRNFLEDRIGFARAGGQDIGTFAGLLSTAILLVIFAKVVPSFVISWVRVPLLVLTSLLLGSWLARIMSRRVFSVLFGDSSHFMRP